MCIMNWLKKLMALILAGRPVKKTDYEAKNQ